MSIEKEIERAVKRTIAFDKDTPPKSVAEQEKVISDIKEALNNSTFNFENFKSLILSVWLNNMIVYIHLKISYVKASNKFWIGHLK
mgnify:CR=1 FL=1